MHTRIEKRFLEILEDPGAWSEENEDQRNHPTRRAPIFRHPIRGRNKEGEKTARDLQAEFKEACEEHGKDWKLSE